jgi:hypothetical protein
MPFCLGTKERGRLLPNQGSAFDGGAERISLKIMIDPNSPASTRVRAADSILDHAAKAIEIEDIEVRVAQLEAAAQKTASTV